MKDYSEDIKEQSTYMGKAHFDNVIVATTKFLRGNNIWMYCMFLNIIMRIINSDSWFTDEQYAQQIYYKNALILVQYLTTALEVTSHKEYKILKLVLICFHKFAV